MKRYPLAFLSGLLAAPALAAAPALDVEARAERQDDPVVQLAQAYDFDVYIDQYGREIVVDPRTGRVVEIRPPLAQPQPIAPRPEFRDYRAGRRDYDFTDPRDVERFHRDREAAIARGWTPEPGYGDPAYPPAEEYPYEDRELPPDQPDYDYGAPPGADGIKRAPLAPPPGTGDFASAPPSDGGTLPDAPGVRQPQPTLPGSPDINVPGSRRASEDVASYQVLLDRAGVSPGVIDGHIGDNVNKAIEAYYEVTRERLKTYDKEWIEAELERTGGPAFIDYTITSEDAAGPFIASVPEDYSAKAQLERLSYTRVSEMLAERFHMDEKFLIDLNPGANFNRPGTIIKVANPGKPETSAVARIVADKNRKQVRLYDESGRLIGAYPATIGSSDTPSPSGIHQVERVALNPNYTYNPKKNFKQGNNEKVLTIPPGPNGPVGSVWIALSKPTYGIHGTPDPSKIGKTYSHGCVRLTNWDAEELAKRVKPGVTVEFAD
ncbi:L,D-transpeptidase [Chelativorans sp. AA-79]|uniref:L,D-transpeptidase n=1 Tax=Chelativorans sp. AA-79 TaxID=3028735 RepID=UPI0023F7C718|nr:L,D-transpeptidase [Chelativorans sp. AA-79]WEX09001.1 L,D-transpeptidase family protein [Chelativorans sp. AA-79]